MSIKLIAKIKDIQHLSADSEQKLLDGLQLHKVKRNGLLLAIGDLCKNIYFIEKGFGRSVMNNDGKEINLNFFADGDFVTKLKSLRTGAPSEYDIRFPNHR